MATYLLGLGAAVCFGVAAVIQQRVAFTAPPGDVLRLRLLLWLVRRPLWDLGVAIGAMGSLLAGAALTHGAVALVEPLQICQLLFALPLAALLARRVVPRRDWMAAAATAAGLALFVFAGDPDVGDSEAATSGGWALTGILVGLIVFGAVWGTRGMAAVRRAPLLAGAAGLLSALQAALVSATGHLLTDDGAGALAQSWFPWAVAAVAVISALLAQSAYEMAPLPASLPASVSVEPLAGVAIGVGLLGGELRLTPLALAGELLGLIVMTVGVRTLARSPLITGQLSRLAARQAQGRLSRLEEQVHHDLERLRHDLRRSRQAGPSGPAARRLRRRLQRDLDRIGEELASLARRTGPLRGAAAAATAGAGGRRGPDRAPRFPPAAPDDARRRCRRCRRSRRRRSRLGRRRRSPDGPRRPGPGRRGPRADAGCRGPGGLGGHRRAGPWRRPADWIDHGPDRSRRAHPRTGCAHVRIGGGAGRARQRRGARGGSDRGAARARRAG
ncbi:DMT family transporter [Frankia sp. QA3]|uniref:DMT family transporter n=1 Tax=Frankia sp. QA3 TaxID=710111 RepID=UPI000269C42F|nr:DMT family transporter [Frankia sp. QA3]EIV94319.1 DMT(drug/metabolite transporter) superfamily permease [Frankia sp. QA3]